MFRFNHERSGATEWLVFDVEMEELLKSHEARDILEKLSVTPPLIENKPARDDPVEDFFKAKFKHARQKIEQQKDIISIRAELHSQAVSQLDYQITKAATSLEEFGFFAVGYNTGVDMKRNHLERQLATFRRDRRENRLKAWQDLSTLKRELRQAIMEYEELTRRYRLVDYKR
jgi:hypothetical protein